MTRTREIPPFSELPPFDKWGVAFKTVAEVRAYDERITRETIACFERRDAKALETPLSRAHVALMYMDHAGVTRTVRRPDEIKTGDIVKTPGGFNDEYTWWRVHQKTPACNLTLRLLFHIGNYAQIPTDGVRQRIERAILQARQIRVRDF